MRWPYCDVPQNGCWFILIKGVKYTSHKWPSFLNAPGLERSISRLGNCHYNAIAESFFQLLKREWIKKKIYGARKKHLTIF
ncbi:DDE-type integrase/transposase/recombinase [Enterobacter mori]|nr:DDE-type integrase/transposase/recombinase [Enterobacter mori]